MMRITTTKTPKKMMMNDNMQPVSGSDIEAFYEDQLCVWPEAAEAYEALGKVERRVVELDGYPVILQYNPLREKSASARIDSRSIASRPCFLCPQNRPEKQASALRMGEMETLINPYPVFPVHLTIASRQHKPQEAWPPEMIELIDMIPSLAAFYNGAKAGASAPDHLHFQAVRKEEIPLLRKVEEWHTADMPPVILSAELPQCCAPAGFISCIITADMQGMWLLSRLEGIGGRSRPGEGMVNIFAWLDDSRKLRLLIFPRKAHRPGCYFREDDSRIMVSPGSLEMAGIVITPRRCDFEKITADDLREIYAQTAMGEDDLRIYSASCRLTQ